MSNLPSGIKKMGNVAADDVKKITTVIPLSTKGGSWRHNGNFPLSPLTISNIWSIDLDGSNETLTLDDHADFDFDWDSEFSISGWVKTTDTGWRGWIKKELTSATSTYFTGWAVGTYNGQPYCNLINHWGTSKAATGITTGVTVHDGNWHHVLCTFDGAGTTAGITMYVDGVSRTVDVWAGRSTLAGNTILNNEPLVIGHMPVNGMTTAYWDGPLDEISVWNKELSSGEVDGIYNGGTPNNLRAHSAAADLLGWWRFGDGPGDSSDSSDSDARVYGQSTGAHNLTPVNTDAGDITEDTP